MGYASFLEDVLRRLEDDLHALRLDGTMREAASSQRNLDRGAAQVERLESLEASIRGFVSQLRRLVEEARTKPIEAVHQARVLKQSMDNLRAERDELKAKLRVAAAREATFRKEAAIKSAVADKHAQTIAKLRALLEKRGATTGRSASKRRAKVTQNVRRRA